MVINFLHSFCIKLHFGVLLLYHITFLYTEMAKKPAAVRGMQQCLCTCTKRSMFSLNDHKLKVCSRSGSFKQTHLKMQ